MTSREIRFAGIWLVVALFALGAFTACSGSSDDSETPTATAGMIATEPASASATPGSSVTPEPAFQGGRDTVEGALGIREGTPPPIGTIADVRAAEQDGYDRIVFEFDGMPPDYRVEYVESPTQCGSGEPVDVQGTALLVVSFEPADAHTEAGEPTLVFQSIAPSLPSIIEAVQSCDFEAHVTWVVGLTEELDFRVSELVDPLRLAVDIAHP